jgi:hypothetical protein
MDGYKECPTCGNTSWKFYKILDNPILDKKTVYVQCSICHLICEEDSVKLVQNSGDHEKEKPWTPSPFIKVHRLNRNNDPSPIYINYNYITRIVPIDDSDDYHSLISMQNHPEWQDFKLKETAEEIMGKIKEDKNE